MGGPYAIGVDMGGTKILSGIVDVVTGDVISTSKQATPRGEERLIESLLSNIRGALAAAPDEIAQNISGIGIGAAGQVDRESGVLLAAPNLGGGVSNIQMVQPVANLYQCPVRLGNDVEVAALGEAYFGAGRDCPLFVCIFVGTGIGGAIVEHGRRFNGATGTAGEIGHIVVKAGGRMCGCGQRGHLEAYASRTAMTSRIRKAIRKGTRTAMRSMLDNPDSPIRAGMFARAINSGDSLTRDVVTEAAEYLGLGLVSVINFYNPQRIILGGGLIEAVDLLYDIATKKAKASSLAVPAASIEIVRAGLGDNSGVVGAALMGYGLDRLPQSSNEPETKATT